MTIKLSSLKTNLADDTAGEWVEYPDWPDVSFLVSPTTLPAYRAAQSAMLSKHARKNAGSLLLDESAPEYGALYAKHLLHGWKGFDEEYSADRAKSMLADPEYRAVTSAVAWCANRAAQVDPDVVKDEVGNSKRSAATS